MNEKRGPSDIVYVVEDDASVRGALERLITMCNWRVRAFETAEAFLSEASEAPGGCLLVDVRLPGMSGLDLMRCLAQADLALPTIVISASHDEDTSSQSFSLGARLVLDKPYEPEVLLDAIAQALA